MNHFAPMLLLGVNANSSKSDLLQTLFSNNESKYLHLLGLEQDTDMTVQANDAWQDIEKAYLTLSHRDEDYGTPIYDVTQDKKVPHAERKKAGRRKRGDLDELKRRYDEKNTGYRVPEFDDIDDLPVRLVTHDEFEQFKHDLS